MMANSSENTYVSRGGIKLAAAMDEFRIDVAGFVCADLGCNVGGFTDAMLQRGAAKVYAVDTGYGALAWTLRNDPRVVVMERTNAMHVEIPIESVDLVVIDMGWTKQRHAIPAALRWKPRKIITLIKPHYETPLANKSGGVLDDDAAASVAQRVLGEFDAWGVKVIAHMQSPIRGGASKGKAGNIEYLTLLEPR